MSDMIFHRWKSSARMKRRLGVILQAWVWSRVTLFSFTINKSGGKSVYWASAIWVITLVCGIQWKRFWVCKIAISTSNYFTGRRTSCGFHNSQVILLWLNRVLIRVYRADESKGLWWSSSRTFQNHPLPCPSFPPFHPHCDKDNPIPESAQRPKCTYSNKQRKRLRMRMNKRWHSIDRRCYPSGQQGKKEKRRHKNILFKGDATLLWGLVVHRCPSWRTRSNSLFDGRMACDVWFWKISFVRVWERRVGFHGCCHWDLGVFGVEVVGGEIGG